ncbi:HAMP domain-containing protein [Pseudobacteriovorax antillogorgiicola]|uniref:Hpt domain-containing protein n=1 Tax=Pseudobacteriovorax antillogorgiicola TaxID=1513793 RepID=A0A1Y6C818_9BACT|nr:HAMP domain-containing protein [Pseudobacteriovorax antillogorgiicola]TCS51771.1 Hpt domain-containing protein [Pseudobacteriovorax antillogorgiicola]SMF49865.1 Hpt domain-containing protein [Pseudobacteriovorax antillogorgiicola]
MANLNRSESIARKLNLRLLILVTLAMTVFSGILGLRNYQKIESTLKARSHSILQLASIAFSEPLWNYDQESIEKFSESIINDDVVEALEVIDQDGNTNYSYSKTGNSDEIAAFSGNSDYLYHEANVIREDNPIGLIKLVVSTKSAKEGIKESLTALAGLTTILLISLAFTLKVTLTALIKKPINYLTGRAAELAGGDLSQSIKTDRNDELGILAGAFDTMRVSIKKKIEDLDFLNLMGETVNQLPSRKHVLKHVLRGLETHTDAQAAVMYNRFDGRLVSEKDFHNHNFYEEIDLSHPELQEKLGTNESVNFACCGLFLSRDHGGQVFVLPLIDEGELVGVIALWNAEGFEQGQDEIGHTLDTLARIVTTRLKNLNMIEIIEDQNRNLERKVEERTAELAEKTNDINAMLQNIPQGIFTIVDGNQIHHEYSHHLEDILGRKDIAQHNAMDLIFARSNLSGDACSQIGSFLDFAIGEDDINYSANQDLLASEIEFRDYHDEKKVLQIDWSPILNDSDEVSKILVSLKDVTDLKALEAQNEAQKRELAMIGQILNVGPSKFREFLTTADSLIEEIKGLAIGNMGERAIAEVKRDLHTLKGNARIRGISYLSEVVHEVEDRFANGLELNSANVIQEVDHIETCVASYSSILNDKLSSQNSESAVSADMVHRLVAIQKMCKETANCSQDVVDAIDDVCNKVQGNHSIDDVINEMRGNLKSIASSLAKPEPVFRVKVPYFEMKPELKQALGNVFPHLINNALDHGIESPEVRLGKNKDQRGTIFVNGRQAGNDMQIEFYDDGQGLDISRIRDKLSQQRGVDASQINEIEVADSIFASGFSTAQKITDISGRGVGLDAVKQALIKLGANIEVRLIGDPTDDGFRQFKFIMKIPIEVSEEAGSDASNKLEKLS